MARIETPRRVRGTQDIFGDEQRRFATVIETFERVRRLYCFQRVDLPVFEATEVFARSIGETTDVVSKEMYSFEDRGGDSLTLRPEFTAGIARAFLSNAAFTAAVSVVFGTITGSTSAPSSRRTSSRTSTFSGSLVPTSM